MKKLTISHTTVAILTGLILSTSVIAQEAQRLGFINTERVYQESKQAQGIQKTLQKEFAGRQKALQKIQAEGERLEKKLLSESLQDADREEGIKKLAEMEQKFRQKQSELAEDYNLRRNEEFAALQQNANRAIVALAKRDGYDLILQDAIYVNSKFDITDEVLREINK